MQLTDAWSNSKWLSAYNILIAAFNLWFAYMIQRNKSLNVHPMKLFMYIAIADSIYYSNQFFSRLLCLWGFPRMLNATVFWNREGPSALYRALYVDFISVQSIEVFGLGLSASLNFCLILDLILMMKTPFANKGQYMTKYLLISPLVALAFAIGVTIQISNK